MKSEGHVINLEDAEGIQLTSGKKVRIIAGSDIKLKGKNVLLETPQEMTMIRNPEGRA